MNNRVLLIAKRSALYDVDVCAFGVAIFWTYSNANRFVDINTMNSNSEFTLNKVTSNKSHKISIHNMLSSSLNEINFIQNQIKVSAVRHDQEVSNEA